MRKGNKKISVEDAFEILSKAIPAFVPGEQGFVVDERAKIIEKIKILEANVKHKFGAPCPETGAREILTSKEYLVQMSSGIASVDEEQIITSFKEASYILGQMLLR